MKNLVKETLSILFDAIEWNEMTNKQKMLCIWFAISFALLIGLFGPFWFELLVVLNFAAASFMLIKNVSIKEED